MVNGHLTVKVSAAAVAAAGLLCVGVAGCSSSTNNSADVSSGQPIQTPAPGTAQGAKWLTAVREDNMAEIQAGKLAQQRGSTQSIRDTGSMLEADHGLIDQGILMLAEKHHVTLPSTLNPPLANEIGKLQGLQGADFDHSFVPFFTAGHQSAIKATEAEIADASQPADVVSYAKAVLPILQRHLSDLQADAAH